MSDTTVGDKEVAARWSAMRHSVFAKLVTIMVTMAASLLVLVGVFFFLIVGPNVHSSIDRVVEEYLRQVVASAPDLPTAKALSNRTGIDIRYEPADGAGWTTAQSMPTIDDVLRGHASKWQRALVPPRAYFIVRSPNGGRYIFGWSVGTRLGEVHMALLALLLAVMIVVVVTTYLVLNRLLAPLRVLNEGVARLSAGELDVQLPSRTRDEFGRLTTAFNRMVGRVRAMIGARDQLLVDVSHELRSPVTRMKVALELTPDNAQRAGMAADLAEMERMITELLELERLRSGRGLQLARLDLLPVLLETVTAFENRAPGVRLTAPAGPQPVDIDVEKIRSVIRNLLENAVKYSLPESRPIEVTVAEEPRRIVVRVTDDGPGIPEQDIDRLFEPFYRADRSRSKATGGYGLGLSICKRAMQAHGGDIILERSPARGATFVLTFPKAE